MEVLIFCGVWLVLGVVAYKMDGDTDDLALLCCLMFAPMAFVAEVLIMAFRKFKRFVDWILWKC